MQSHAFAIIATAAVLASGTAFAQSTNSGASSGTSPQTSQSTQSLPQAIRQKLENQGFTNVQIVPGSFLISAKDKNGDPVNMVIGPHSAMMFTEISPSQSGTTGSGSQNSSGSMNQNSSGSTNQNSSGGTRK